MKKNITIKNDDMIKCIRKLIFVSNDDTNKTFGRLLLDEEKRDLKVFNYILNHNKYHTDFIEIETNNGLIYAFSVTIENNSKVVSMLGACGYKDEKAESIIKNIQFGKEITVINIVDVEDGILSDRDSIDITILNNEIIRFEVLHKNDDSTNDIKNFVRRYF